MRDLASFSSTLTYFLELWIWPMAILVLTIFAVALTRHALSRFTKAHHFSVLEELIPACSNLVYIVGLKMFSEAAPLRPSVAAWLDSGVYVVGVFLLLVFLRRTALLTIEWSVNRSQNSKTLQQGFIPLMKNLITLFVFLSGAIMILQHFRYDVLSLLTALGVGSLAVGLAAKETLTNMISGFTLIIDQNLRPGDRIQLAGTFGVINDIGLRSTKIRTDDGNTLIVPNAEMTNNRILNLSQPSRALQCNVVLNFPLHVAYSKIQQICSETLEQLPQLKKDPTPHITVNRLTAGAQQIGVSFWISDINDEANALSEFHVKILNRLHQEGIQLATPA